MKATEAIVELKRDIKHLRGKGQSVVSVQALDEYLDLFDEQHDGPPDVANRRQQLYIAQYDAHNKANLELFKSVVDSGKDALNTALIINGGAILAVLSFLGATAGRGWAEHLGLALTRPLVAFGTGIACAAMSFGTRYGSQYCYHEDYNKTGNAMLGVSVALGLAAFGSFCVGVWRAHSAFVAHFSGALVKPTFF